jgi:glucan biosynthesis protein C
MERVVSQARPDGGTTRRAELDLLRALVVVGLVFFHTAVIFGAGEFPVKAEAQNRAVTVVLAFGATWGMPLLFFISGMGICYALRSRSATEFAHERLRRLGIPLATGLLTLVPLQVYLGRRRAGDTSSYASFYARFWDVRPTLHFPFVLTAAPDGVFVTGHLWFLVCLLAFSLLLLPGFLFLRAPRGARVAGWLAGLLGRPGALFLPALPLVAVEVGLGSEVGYGAWNLGSYALFLGYGFLAARSEGIGKVLQQRYRAAAAIGVVLFAATGAAYAAASGRSPSWAWPAAAWPVAGGHRRGRRLASTAGPAWWLVLAPMRTRRCCRSMSSTRRSSWSSPFSCWPGRSGPAPSTA